LVRADGKSLTLFADVAGVGLRLDAPHASRKGSAVVPLDLLKSLERADPDPVKLVPQDSGAGLARWAENGTAVERDFPAAPPDSFRPFPLPRRWSPETERFRTALHEAGKTAARQRTRYAIDRVQVRGKAGQVVASDARQALIQGGFVFPFTEDLCVSAVPIFGVRELAGAVRLGRTASHLVVGVGEWTVWLPADPPARYPDVAAVVPQPAEPSRIDFGDADADRLLAPAGLDQLGDAVTLDASAAGVRLRRRPGRGGPIELELVESHRRPAGAGGSGSVPPRSATPTRLSRAERRRAGEAGRRHRPDAHLLGDGTRPERHPPARPRLAADREVDRASRADSPNPTGGTHRETLTRTRTRAARRGRPRPARRGGGPQGRAVGGGPTGGPPARRSQGPSQGAARPRPGRFQSQIARPRAAR
jgi:hypothetical protein